MKALLALLMMTVTPPFDSAQGKPLDPARGRQDVPPPGISKDKAFPDFLLPNVEGGSGRLSDHRGKKLLVFNFASW